MASKTKLRLTEGRVFQESSAAKQRFPGVRETSEADESSTLSRNDRKTDNLMHSR